jgi:hypothetical protein
MNKLSANILSLICSPLWSCFFIIMSFSYLIIWTSEIITFLICIIPYWDNNKYIMYFRKKWLGY